MSEIFLVSAKLSKLWITVAFKDGTLLANSIPSEDRECSKRSALEALDCRGIDSSELAEPDSEEGKRIAGLILSSSHGGWKNIPLSFDGMTDFQKKVLEYVWKIPAGKVASYGDVATAVGRPRAYRAVGSVMAKNPFPYIIPCHRVIKSDLSTGQYGHDPEMKVKFLREEGIEIVRGKVMAKYRLAQAK